MVSYVQEKELSGKSVGDDGGTISCTRRVGVPEVLANFEHAIEDPKYSKPVEWAYSVSAGYVMHGPRMEDTITKAGNRECILVLLSNLRPNSQRL